MRLKILTYNIHKGNNWLNTADVLHHIKKGIHDLDLDLCFLQEVQGGKKLAGDFETQFEFLADSVWHHYSYGKNAVYPDSHHGNAILTKYPIQRYHNLNITTNRFEKRGLLHCEISILDGNEATCLHLLNTHLNLTEGGRSQQTEFIAEYVAEHIPENHPLILAGDLNDWNGQISKKIKAKMNLTEVQFASEKISESVQPSRLNFGLKKRVATFPSFFPIFHLDRVFYRNLKIEDTEVLDFAPWTKLSDHLPLFVEFTLLR